MWRKGHHAKLDRLVLLALNDWIGHICRPGVTARSPPYHWYSHLSIVTAKTTTLQARDRSLEASLDFYSGPPGPFIYVDRIIKSHAER